MLMPHRVSIAQPRDVAVDDDAAENVTDGSAVVCPPRRVEEPPPPTTVGMDGERTASASVAKDYETPAPTAPEGPPRLLATPRSVTMLTRDFDEDLEDWVSNNSEAFHARIFCIELFGQLSFTFLGPLSWPWIWPLYGGAPGLKNRGFLPAGMGRDRFFYGMSIVNAMTVIALVLWWIWNPPGLILIELKFIMAVIVMRNLTIAIKYAYMTTQAWTRLNEEVLCWDYLGALLIVPWFTLSRSTMHLQAEISFVGVLGSREQRQRLRLRFLGWPSKREAIAELRTKVDFSSKALSQVPTGEIQKSTSRFRKRVLQRVSDMEVREGSEMRHAQSVVAEGRIQIAKLVPSTSRSKTGDLDKEIVACEEGKPEEAQLEQMEADADAQIFAAAAAGKSVSVEELFLYLLRGLVRSQKAHIPSKGSVAIIMLALLTVLAPSIMRRLAGEDFLGGSSASTAIVILMWPQSILCFYSCLSFVYVGAVDMWRRRAMLRSCSCLLTLDREFRRHCVTEMDLLPPLDLSDPHTIEGWRKLRQLCQDFGRFYYLRIQTFATLFFGCALIILADQVASMQLQTYMDFVDMRLSHLLVAGSLAMSVLICILFLVYFGNEVNDMAACHVMLLHRQRVLLNTRRQREAIDALREGRPLSEEDDVLERLASLLEVLCTDIQAEFAVKPVKLLGLYCGYSLLSVLYFIPAGVIASLSRFCSNPETMDRCSIFGG